MFFSIIFSCLPLRILGGPKTDLSIYFDINFTLDIIFTIIIPNLTATLRAGHRLKLSTRFIEKESEIRVATVWPEAGSGALGLA